MKLINNLAEGDKHDVAFSRDAERESPNYPIPGNGFLEGFAAAAAADSAISFRTRFRQIRILVRCFPRDADDNDDTPDDDDDEPLPYVCSASLPNLY